MVSNYEVALDEILKKHHNDQEKLSETYANANPRLDSIFEELGLNSVPGAPEDEPVASADPAYRADSDLPPLYQPENTILADQENFDATETEEPYVDNEKTVRSDFRSLRKAAPTQPAPQPEEKSVPQVIAVNKHNGYDHENKVSPKPAASVAAPVYTTPNIPEPKKSSPIPPEPAKKPARKQPRSKEIAIAILSVVIIVLLALIAILISNNNKVTNNSAPNTSAEENNKSIIRQAKLYYEGGAGYVILVRDDIEISHLSFKSGLTTGQFEVRSTTIAQPEGGTIIGSGNFTNADTVYNIDFDKQTAQTIVVVYKNVDLSVAAVTPLNDVNVW
jgi:hypothetical protein